MGGIGSGRKPSRPTLGQLRRIRIGAFYPNGSTAPHDTALQWRDGHVMRAKVTYDAIEGPNGLRHTHRTPRIQVVWHACQLGGHRPYFCCPLCTRHCVYLYLYDQRLSCRKCTGLLYESQTHTKVEYLFGAIDRIQRRIAGPSFDLRHYPLHALPPKRLRMRWTTYRLLGQALESTQQRQTALFLASLGSRKPRNSIP